MPNLADLTVPPGYWARDTDHQIAPMVPLMASVWCEPYTRGFADAFARWGYLGDGVAAVSVAGWCFVGFRPLADPGLVPVRIARAVAAAAADEHLGAARDWFEVTRPGFERQRERLAAADAGPGRLEGAARLVREVVRVRFAVTSGVQELVVEWVLQAGERYGWSAERALALAAGPARIVEDLREVLAAVERAPVLAARLDAGEIPTLADLRTDPGVAAALTGHLHRRGDTLLRLDLTGPTLAERPDHLAGAVAAAWTRHRRPPVVAADEALLDADARAVLDRARIAYPQRDDGGDLLTRCLGLLRRAALDAGTRLGLPAPSDALLLTAEELAEALRLGHADPALVERRRAEHDHAVAHVPPLTVGDPPGPPPDPSSLPRPAARAMQRLGVFVALMSGPAQAPPDRPEIVTGVPAGTGRYTGVVRVARTVDEASDVEAGEVLVCPVTAPAWNLAMGRAGALVCDVGGQLSHAAITARELGIPAVVGCRTATATLRTGDVVTVDGTAGTVRPA
jgi:phosphohistidine swiveling domain-containing protein